MLKRNCFWFILITIIAITYIGGSMSCKNGLTGGPHYYKGWKSYIIPYQPINEISFGEAKKLDAYYEAYYNENGKLVKFTKILKGKKDFTVLYFYRQDGTIESGEMTKSDGEKVIQHFDKSGKLIKN